MNYTENILLAYDASSADDLAQGLQWYGLAYELAAGLAGSDYDHETCAGVIAAMSPMMNWASNIRVARALVERHRDELPMPTAGFGLGRNVAKAWRILEGEDPTEVLSGLKVRAFYANILGDPDAVTVDRWAARIARNDYTDKGLVTTREYREIADAYREAAAMRGISARDLQAAVWTYARRLHGEPHNDPQGA